jgi:hypothetical protein
MLSQGTTAVETGVGMVKIDILTSREVLDIVHDYQEALHRDILFLVTYPQNA